jgi:hypothetical protein
MSDSFLNLIRKGIASTTHFDYCGIDITLRAVSSSELDDAKYKSQELCDDKLARMILRMRMGQINGKIDIDSIPAELYKNYIKYILEFDYWVVYYAMKDFQPTDFSFDDVRKMRYVHEIADIIINISSSPNEVVIEFVKTEDGQELAKIIYELKQPLAMIKDLTSLQHSFLLFSSPNAPKHVGNSLQDLEKALPAIGDMMRHAR